MALWLVRAGRHGEHESKFFADSRIYLTWDNTFKSDPTHVKDYDEVRALVDGLWPTRAARKQGNTAGQFWAFLVGMKPGDLVVTPLKHQAAIAVGEVTGPPVYMPDMPDMYRVARPINWMNTAVPRAAFDQDVLYSMGAQLTVCRVKAEGAEARLRAMSAAGWKNAGPAKLKIAPSIEAEEAEESETYRDLAEAARDQLTAEILRIYKGHKMQRLVEGILQAQGFSTFVPPDGPDRGIDVVAAPGPLGFGSPRICVQVKSSDGQADRPTLQQLTGAMKDVGAEHGLLVSWGGFKSTVEKDRAMQFFNVRFWDAGDLVRAVQDNYAKLPAEIREELPLKQTWVLMPPVEEADEE